jgi:hypothetical protein
MKCQPRTCVSARMPAPQPPATRQCSSPIRNPSSSASATAGTGPARPAIGYPIGYSRRFVASPPQRVLRVPTKKVLFSRASPGETRTRTGDTAIFSRYVESVRGHAIPGKQALPPQRARDGDVSTLRVYRHDSGDGWPPIPFLSPPLLRRCAWSGSSKRARIQPGRAVPFREQTPGDRRERPTPELGGACVQARKGGAQR